MTEPERESSGKSAKDGPELVVQKHVGSVSATVLERRSVVP